MVGALDHVIVGEDVGLVLEESILRSEHEPRTLAETAAEAIGDIRRDALRAGLIPIVNAMATAGIVSLPGMMTGQILAGSSPLEAVTYQILIMLLIAVGTGFGTPSTRSNSGGP